MEKFGVDFLFNFPARPCRQILGYSVNRRGELSKLRCMDRNHFERKAGLVYAGTKWEKAAIAAGKAMDNRLHDTPVNGTFGQSGVSSFFDVQAWLVWFDWEVLERRGLLNKAYL